MAYTHHFCDYYYAFEKMTGGVYCGAVFWRTALSLWGLIFFSLCIGHGYVPY